MHMTANIIFPQVGSHVNNNDLWNNDVLTAIGGSRVIFTKFQTAL
jgi:hypothetical protein